MNAADFEFGLQDSHAHSEAQTWVRNHEEEIVKMRGSLDKMEGSLEKEEIELDKIRDGLKGTFITAHRSNTPLT